MYQIRILDVAERELAQLDKTVGRRIVKRIRWLAENVEDIKAAEPCAIGRFPYYPYLDIIQSMKALSQYKVNSIETGGISPHQVSTEVWPTLKRTVSKRKNYACCVTNQGLPIWVLRSRPGRTAAYPCQKRG